MGIGIRKPFKKKHWKMKTYIIFACFTPNNFDCRRVTGTFPDPRDCGQSFVQCPNPQGGSTGAAISCGRGSWFDPVVCNCQPGRPNCSAIRGGGSSSSGGGFGGSSGFRPQSQRPQRPSR